MAELLREGAANPDAQVIRSVDLVNELKTYIRWDNGRHGADASQHDDLLMSFMIGQRIRELEREPVALSSPPTAASAAPSKPKRNRYGR